MVTDRAVESRAIMSGRLPTVHRAGMVTMYPSKLWGKQVNFMEVRSPARGDILTLEAVTKDNIILLLRYPITVQRHLITV